MAIFAAFLMTLSMVGITYAAWRDEVEIQATIHMGELIVGWNNTNYVVSETTNGFPEGEYDHGYTPKTWVANTTIKFEEPETSVHLEPPKTVYKEMYINVTNAYPQYDAHIDVYISNAGTIPACIYKEFALDFYDETDDEDLSYVLEAGYPKYDPILDEYQVKGAIVDPDDGPIINFNFTIHDEEETLQIDSCEQDLVEIDVDFKQEAEECHTYTFKVKILAIQWNKLHKAADYKPTWP